MYRARRGSQNLVGCWPLNGMHSGEAREIANNVNGTWSGTGTHYISSERGGVAHFPSKDDYISLGAGWLSWLSGDVTVALWVYLDSLDAGSKNIIGGDLAYSSAFMFSAFDTSLGTGVRLYFGDTGVNADGLTAGANARWHRVAFTKSGSTLNLYVDGVLRGTPGTFTSPSFSNSTVLKIGGGSWGTAYAMRVSDVRFYSRALSDAEIKEDYAQPTMFYRVRRRLYRRTTTTFVLNAAETQSGGQQSPGVNRIDTLPAGFPDGDFTITVTKGEAQYVTPSMGADSTAAAVLGNINNVLFGTGMSVTAAGGPHDTADITLEWPAANPPDAVVWTYSSQDYSNVTQSSSPPTYRNERQSLAFSDLPLSGAFTLTVDGHTTSPIAWNATAEQIAAAIEAAVDGATVAVSSGGVMADGDAIVLEFQGSLAGTDIALITGDLTELSTLAGTSLVGMGVYAGLGILS